MNKLVILYKNNIQDKNTMRAFLVFALLGISFTFGYSQTKPASVTDVHNIYDEKGDYYFDHGNKKKAIVYYNMAYNKDAKNYYSVLRKAEAFSALKLYDQAAACYKIVFESGLYVSNEHRLKYALLLLQNRDISGFEQAMRDYNKIVNEEISGYITSSAARAKMYKDSSFVIVENASVLNSPESEISPMVYNDKVVFASTRKNLPASSANGYYNLFTAGYLSDGQLGRLNYFNKSLNSTKSECGVSINPKEKQLYVTRGESINSNLSIVKSKIPLSAGESVSSSAFDIGGIKAIGQVSFNSTGTKVYFVSDKAGGNGGLDIYSSELKGGKWSQPVNMGSGVNSSKNENYPFVLNDTMLYFSSEGHNGNGGYDLFEVNLKKDGASAKNLGTSVNTKYDEYGLSFSKEGFTGYFSSNRPGGFGKEDIYRIHMLDIKVKYAAYKFKPKTNIEEGKINLYMANGNEYNIGSKDNSSFNFGFQPQEPYKMVIQHEDALASNIIYNTKLSAEQKKQQLLNPKPIQKTEIKLEPGMRYQFSAGMKPLSSAYKSALKDLSNEYQGGGSSIDLTALAKELQLKDGEVYTIRFIKDNGHAVESKSKEVSSVFIDGVSKPTDGSSFFIVLPLDVEANFNIKTDIDYFKENNNPKKVGALNIDDKPVYKEDQVKMREGFPILVNTENTAEIVARGKIQAKELSIVPGSMYILTLAKHIEGVPNDVEIVVPLTKGVKYDLGAENTSQVAYQKAVSNMASGKSGDSGELIDISVLSSELNIAPTDNIEFSLMPAPRVGEQTAGQRNILTTLNVDGRKFFVTDRQKLQVNLKLEKAAKVNIQTDLAYVKENFDPSTVKLNLDTTSFNTKIKKAEAQIITDPVFDVVVVNFDLNAYSLRPEAKNILAEKVIKVLDGDSRLYVTIKGYTDPLGNAEYNKKLSEKRAITVKDFLKNNGIGDKRIRTFSFGESLSLKDGEKWENLSEAELQKHRKVEIVIYLPKDKK